MECDGELQSVTNVEIICLELLDDNTRSKCCHDRRYFFTIAIGSYGCTRSKQTMVTLGLDNFQQFSIGKILFFDTVWACRQNSVC